MAKQLNVKLNFAADTKEAERALHELSTHLNKIATITPTQGLPLTKDLQVAKTSAKELQQHLLNAFNVKTGNLDLNKLNTSLKSSGQSLGQLSSNLLKAGTTGEQAFLSLQRSVSNASVQINQANGALTQFWTTMKNTARWQLSSSMLHGFIGALNSAWGYAKDLDKSLNNIRIVTGYSSDEMVRFADAAQKAAKQLSTTTTKYTDAALIYYQQGLNAEEVAKRTEITIKMANAAGQSAQVVSDQLTAVWNNFYDGTKSLEYYADVMTALGAATASSTDEIAGGLEKFAAIGETIGLSYEYAASALTTITANTRQSEEVVGTALKTIFARIQGLSLGETLDDGTNLNKYSEALQKVGISIFDQAGELKAMDSILEEMGAKWQTISKDQQVALAQTVAGVRQYNQLVSLMDNWDSGDSDSMQANLETAYGSEGALDQQAAIYADSWEAAVNRVRASAEGIYKDLFPTEEMTGMMDAFAVILDGVDGLVEGLGGLQGILMLISSVALTKFKAEIGAGIDTAISKVTSLVNIGSYFKKAWSTEGVVASTKNISNNLTEIQSKTGDATAQANVFKNTLSASASEATKTTFELAQSGANAKDLSASFKQYSTNLMQVNNVQASIEQASKHLTSAQREQLVLLQQQALAANEQLLAAENTYNLELERSKVLINSTGDEFGNLDRFRTTEDTGSVAFDSGLFNSKTNHEAVERLNEAWNKVNATQKDAQMTVSNYKNHISMILGETTDLESVNKGVKNSYSEIYKANLKIAEIQKTMKPGDQAAEIKKVIDALKQQDAFTARVVKSYVRGAQSAENMAKRMKQAESDTRRFAVATGSSEKHISQMEEGIVRTNAALQQSQSAAENFRNKMEQAMNSLSKGLAGAMSIGNVAASMASGLSSVAMGVTSISNAIDTLNDEDASFATKLSAGAMAATMGIRALTTTLGGLNTIINSVKAATAMKQAVDMASAVATGKQTQAELENLLVTKLGVAEDKKAAAAEAIVAAAKKSGTASTIKDTIANWANVASQAAKFWYISLIIIAIAALTALIWAAVTAEDAETKALNAANDALKDAQEGYNAAKDAVQSFKDTVKGYEEGIQGLKDLEAGTDEMAEAVDAANEKARQLIETFGLFGKYKYGANGEIIFDDGVLESIEAELEASEKLAEQHLYTAKIRQQKAQTDYDNKQFANNHKIKYTSVRTYDDSTGATTGYLNPNDYQNQSNYSTWQHSTGGYNEDGTYSSSQSATKTELTMTATHMEQFSDIIGQATEALGHVPENADELKKYITGLGDACKLPQPILLDLENILTDSTFETLMQFHDGMEDATAASLYYAEKIMGLFTNDEYAAGIEAASGGDKTKSDLMYQVKDRMLADGKITVDGKEMTLAEYTKSRQEELNTDSAMGINEKKNGNGVENAVKGNINDILGEDGGTWLKDHYGEIFKGTTQSYDGNINVEEMARAYFESQGYKIEGIKMEDGQVKISGSDAAGNALTDQGYDYDTIQRYWGEQINNFLIDQQVSSQATNLLDPAKFEEAMTAIVANGEQFGADWSNAILAGMANNGDFDFSSLFSEISPEEYQQMMNMSENDLAAMFGLTPEDLKAFGFEKAGDFKAAFEEGMEGWDPKIFEKGTDQEYDMKAEGLGLDVEELDVYRELLAETYPELKNNRKALNEVAIANKRLEKGVKSLAGNWEDFDKAMTDNSLSMEDMSAILPDINEGVQDMLNISDEEFELLPPDFAKKNWKLIQDVMNGVEGSVDELRNKAGEEILLNVGAKVDADGDGSVDAAFMEIHNKIAEYDNMEDFKVGVAIDPAKHAEFIASCNELINAAGMTAQQAQAYFASMGYDVELEEVEAPPKETPWHIDNPVLDEAKTKEAGVPIFSGTETLTGTNTSGGGKALAVKTITPNGSFGGGTGVNTTAPKGATDKKGGGGGGGSKPKKTKDSRKKKDEMVDRYKEINDELEETQRLMKKNTTLADGLYGAKRFAKLRENIKLMEQENKQLEEKYQMTLDYLEADEAALKKAASEAGVSFNIDTETGNITNYTQQMTALWEERERLLDSFGAEMDEKEQERLEDFDKRVEALEQAYEQYEKTLDEKKDAEEEHLAKILEIQTAYYDLLNEELEVKISLNEDDLSTLEYYLGKISDDFYQMAEAAALMLEGVDGTGRGQIDIYSSNLQHQKDYIDELNTKHTTINPETGETYINDAQYVEGIRAAKDAIIENLNSLNELDKTMMHYYGDTIAMAQDELAKYTDQMEHHSSVLDHYQTILELTGKQNDYESLGVVLEGQAKTAENRVAVAKDAMEMYKGQAEDRYAEYQQALAAGDSAAAELYLKQYEEALAAANEAEEEYLSSAEEWAEALRAVLENTMKGLAQDLENTLTGGTSFDQMTTAMERAASLQEEYLTTTNQIYETNKLMRTAQQEIDKSTNSVAKRKLKQFIDETEQMQNQSKLSKYELDIQQAKYDLLLAEIALEEAQNAKSTVRLQRDSEGNFGYVYTADQGAVDQAEQDMLDKQNALYNIGLEGANDYAQKYQQTLNEMYDAITELQQQKLEGMFETEEEYQEAVKATKEFYYQKLADYSNLYSVALTTDSNVVQDAWSTDFNKMIYSTDDWKVAVNDYISQVQDALTEYESQMHTIAGQTVGNDLSTLKSKTDEVTQANDALLKKITGKDGVIDGLEGELNAVANLTGKYATMRQEIQNLVDEYERLLGVLDQDVEDTTNGDTPPAGDPPKSDPPKDDGDKKDNAKQIAEEAAEIIKKVHNGTIKQTSAGWIPSARNAGYSENAISIARQAFNDSKAGGGYSYCYEKALKLVGLDTGGYTGDWEGSYGKLALLHKKELVLSEGDTENFLEGMDLLNRIISVIDLHSMNSQLGGMLSSPSLGNMGSGDTLEQQVHIEASFPGVQDRNEIEEAFNTLINRASQYANRK